MSFKWYFWHNFKILMSVLELNRIYSRDKANISNPKVNRGCATLTANRTSADCVQISLGSSKPYISLGVYHAILPRCEFPVMRYDDPTRPSYLCYGNIYNREDGLYIEEGPVSYYIFVVLKGCLIRQINLKPEKEPIQKFATSAVHEKEAETPKHLSF